jgi:hypothetical protein
MITLPVSAAEAILSALLNRSVTLDWVGDIPGSLERSLPKKRRRGRKPGKPKKLTTSPVKPNGSHKTGKRHYTKRSKFWASKK